VATGYWSLTTGLRAGMNVGRGIAESWLPRAALLGGNAAGFLVGMAIPLTARLTLDWAARSHVITALAASLAWSSAIASGTR
jgi:hypothetical protein